MPRGQSGESDQPGLRRRQAIGGAQPFYDWAGVNQANANGNHQAVVPDGELCSGGNSKYRGLDLNRSDWPTSPIRADSRGRYTFEFKAPAPHATREWKFYVTRDGWQPGSPLRWADLQEFCTLGNVPVSGDVYKLDCPLPKRSGQHIIYNTWQRSDSGEAFYTCADVRFEGGGGVEPPPQWQDAGPVTARGALEEGTTLTLRVFNAQGNDLERPEITLAAGQTAANQWPLALARKVNASAQQARVGVMRNGVITPVASATENRVYLKPGNLFQIDTRLPGPVDPVDPPPGDDYDFVYPVGIGSYTPGEPWSRAPTASSTPAGRSRRVRGATSTPMPIARAPVRLARCLGRVLRQGTGGGVAPPPILGVAGQRPALPGSWGCRPAAGTTLTYLLLTYFSRRICGLPKPAAFSSSAQASTMSGLPHR